MFEEKESIHRLFRRRRLEAGLTQSELARQADCRQSAISMFEAGRTDVLSREKLAVIAERLGIDPGLLPAVPEAPVPATRAPRRLAYCPVDECPSNIPYTVRGELYFRPTFTRVSDDHAGPAACAWCGELLECRCPNPDCGAPAREARSICPLCGTLYVTPIVVAGQSPEQREAWAAARRRLIGELRDLSGTG